MCCSQSFSLLGWALSTLLDIISRPLTWDDASRRIRRREKLSGAERWTDMLHLHLHGRPVFSFPTQAKRAAELVHYFLFLLLLIKFVQINFILFQFCDKASLSLLLILLGMPHPGYRSPSHLCSSPQSRSNQSRRAQCYLPGLGRRHWCRQLQTEDYTLLSTETAPSQSPDYHHSWLLQSLSWTDWF